MASYNIEITWFVSEEEIDLSICSVCNEIIYGKTFKVIFQFGSAIDLKFSDSDLIFCESCYNLIKNKI